MATVTDAKSSVLSAEFVEKLRDIVGKQGLLSDADELLVYECDGYIVEKKTPDVVVFPTSTEQVSRIAKLCHEHKVPFLARGAGTSLSGGCLPIGGGVMIALTRMNHILKVNLRDRYAVVEAGVVNLKLTQHLQGTGFHYAPDPSSQGACTIGGNIAANAGGPHTLKYGVTVNHVLGMTVVLPDGSIVELGGEVEEMPGYDLRGLFIGSEGTFGIVTEATVRLTRDPAAFRTMRVIFDTIDNATQTISKIIGEGIIPAALEMMDQGIIEAVESAFHFGFPLDAEAIVIIECDGLEVAVDDEAQRVIAICEEMGAREVLMANSDEERQALWKCRKQAFGALGRLGSCFCTQDGMVPRTRLPEILHYVIECGKRHGIRIVNVFHAGDGNIHPILLFDEREPEQIRTVLQASDEILAKCVELGGSVTGEHGIGVEKLSFLPRIFTPDDLAVMADIRNVFNEHDLCSRQKKQPPTGEAALLQCHPGRRANS